MKKEFNTAIENLRFVISQLRAVTVSPLDEGQIGELRRCVGMLESLLRLVEDGPRPGCSYREI